MLRALRPSNGLTAKRCVESLADCSPGHWVCDEWAKSARLAVRRVGKVCPFADAAGCSTESACSHCIETLAQVAVGRIWPVDCTVPGGRWVRSGESAGRGAFCKRFRRSRRCAAGGTGSGFKPSSKVPIVYREHWEQQWCVAPYPLLSRQTGHSQAALSRRQAKLLLNTLGGDQCPYPVFPQQVAP